MLQKEVCGYKECDSWDLRSNSNRYLVQKYYPLVLFLNSFPHYLLSLQYLAQSLPSSQHPQFISSTLTSFIPISYSLPLTSYFLHLHLSFTPLTYDLLYLIHLLSLFYSIIQHPLQHYHPHSPFLSSSFQSLFHHACNGFILSRFCDPWQLDRHCIL